MTTTVNVRARAWPVIATVKSSTEGEQGHNVSETTFTVESHTERSFHLSETESINVVAQKPDTSAEVNERPFKDEEVPGRKQNDEFLKPLPLKGSKAEDAAKNTEEKQPA